MKKVIFLAALVALIAAVYVYGQDSAGEDPLKELKELRAKRMAEREKGVEGAGKAPIAPPPPVIAPVPAAGAEKRLGFPIRKNLPSRRRTRDFFGSPYGPTISLRSYFSSISQERTGMGAADIHKREGYPLYGSLEIPFVSRTGRKQKVEVRDNTMMLQTGEISIRKTLAVLHVSGLQLREIVDPKVEKNYEQISLDATMGLEYFLTHGGEWYASIFPQCRYEYCDGKGGRPDARVGLFSSELWLGRRVNAGSAKISAKIFAGYGLSTADEEQFSYGGNLGFHFGKHNRWDIILSGRLLSRFTDEGGTGTDCDAATYGVEVGYHFSRHFRLSAGLEFLSSGTETEKAGYAIEERGHRVFIGVEFRF